MEQKNIQWIYVYEEPVAHKGIYEFGMTTRTVEQRNKEKRSIHKWKLKAKYAVVKALDVERKIIDATEQYRFDGRKEILSIDWKTFETILDPIVKAYTHKEYNKRVRDNFINLALKTYHKDSKEKVKKEIWDPSAIAHEEKANKEINALQSKLTEYNETKSAGTIMTWFGLVFLVAIYGGIFLSPYKDQTFDNGNEFLNMMFFICSPFIIIWIAQFIREKAVKKIEVVNGTINYLRNKMAREIEKFYKDEEAKFKVKHCKDEETYIKFLQKCEIKEIA